MPKLRMKSDGSCYTLKLIGSQVRTLQISPEGMDWLFASGYKVGDELGEDYWELVDNKWIFTLGLVQGGGDLGPESASDNRPDSILTTPNSEQSKRPYGSHGVTFRSDTKGNLHVPRFLYDTSLNLYYTDLFILNSDPGTTQLRVLIKNRGAVELLKSGMKVGDEFSLAGLKLLFSKRWVYRNA